MAALLDGRRQTDLGVAALAAAALLLESTLTRLLAVAQFYHFAFLVVSLALLGFGASGTLLSLLPRLSRIPPPILLARAGAAFTAATGLAYLVVNFLPFDSYSIAWDRRQVVYFAGYYLALTLPFICAGLGIGAALAAAEGRSHRVYAANLLGSALGVLLAPAAMWLAGVPGAVIASALLALLPAASRAARGEEDAPGPVANIQPETQRITLSGDRILTVAMRPRCGRSRRAGPPKDADPRIARALLAACFIAGVTALVFLGARNLSGRGVLGLALSPYKGISYARQYPGSRPLFGQWDAVSRVDVLADAGTRLLPGISYTYAGEPPSQLGVALDGDSLLPVPLEPPEAFTAADFMPEAIAFDLRPAASTLVLEPAGGLGILQALAGPAGEVTVVTGNALVPEAIRHAGRAPDLYGYAGVRTVTANPRVYLSQPGPPFGIIFAPLTDPYRPVASGAYSLAETYGLTVEAFTAALGRLEPGGLLAVTRWLQIPPSEDLRLIATLAAALERTGDAQPADALVAYRGIQTLTVLVNPVGWTAEELAEVREFAAARRYDLVWAPDIRADEINRYNRLPVPDHYNAVRALLTSYEGGAAAGPHSFYAGYPFAVEPVTDDRPFFFHFFRWTQTPEVLATLGRTWQPFGGSGYLILFALLALVLVLSTALILLPLSLKPRDIAPRASASEAPMTTPTLTILGYFGLLGLAFLCIEIPLIQRWLLVFGHATYAFTAVVLVILLGSSIGSLLTSADRVRRLGPRPLLLLLAAAALVTALAGSAWVEAALGWPTAVRILALSLTLAPLAVLMGLPFPLGLAWLERATPGAVPWAWAVNGCASVLASVIAAILALSYGLTAILVIGGLAYALAAVTLPRQANALPRSAVRS